MLHQQASLSVSAPLTDKQATRKLLQPLAIFETSQATQCIAPMFTYLFFLHEHTRTLNTT